MNKTKTIAQELLSKADIQINGTRPWDIQVNNEKLYSRVLSKGSLGLGEAYMDGWWDCKQLDVFFTKILSAELDKKVKYNLGLVFEFVKSRILNAQTIFKSKVVGEKHYDIGNDLYKNMLDKRMVYSCGYWKNTNNLDRAQEAKLDLICKKLGLKQGMKVLDIGCGWGSFLKFAVQKYKVEAVGVTISKEQLALAKESCKGLPIDLRLQDYRLLNEKFDRIISIGMFEHVGYKNYKTFMEVVNRCLKDNGLFMLHTIGGNTSVKSTDLWVGKYIFPNSMLPSIKQIASSIEKFFVMEDLHNFSADYDKTLMAWFNNFDKSWDKIKSKYNERFYRMWKYYLLCCAGSFRARKNQLWQIVLSKKGVPGGYISIR